MKKVFKYIGYTLSSLIGLILLYLGCAWVLSRIGTGPEVNARQEISIYVKTNGVHADLVIPVKSEDGDWRRIVSPVNTRSGDSSCSYIAFGWGDKGFYLRTPTWADLKASTAFRAAFGLDSAAMHITYYHTLVENGNCVRLMISRDQHRRLVDFIKASLYDSGGHAIVIPTEMRYNNNDAFYEAKGRYSLFHTCNTWANDGLKAAGQRACLWTPFDKGIFYQLRR